MLPDPPAGPSLRSSESLIGRALRGSILVSARGLVAKAAAAAAAVGLSRVLSPSEFGAIALGLTMVNIGGTAFDGGLGAGLIRRAGAPSQLEYEVVQGLQLAITTVIIFPLFAWGILATSQLAYTSFVCALSLPILALRTPVLIELERELVFSPQAIAESVEVTVFVLTAIPFAALWGPVGVAGAVVIRALTGTLILYGRAKRRPCRLRFDYQRVRALLRFGTLYQLPSLVALVRDEGVNIIVLALAGQAALGVWAAASRILQLPYLLFQSLWRISFPLFARWRDSGRELKQLVVAVVTTTTAGGIILCVVVAGPVQQLVPSLLGRDWLDMQNVLVISALALAISGPISVAAAGALYAEGRAGAVLISVSMGAAAWILVLVPWLLIHAAPASVAGSWFVGAVVEAGAFSLFMRRGGFPVAAGVAWRVTVGCLIAAPALFVTRQVSSAEAAAIWFMVLSLLAALASFTNFGRFRDVWSLVRAGALG